MEFRVGGNEVLLSLDRAYIAEDDTALLQQISRFKPLVDYLTTFKPQDFVVSTLTVTNVSIIAGRISAVRGVVTLKRKSTKATQAEPLFLSDQQPAIVLPVITVGARHFAVLISRPRLAIGGAPITEAFEGTFGEDGAFQTEGADLLHALGLQITEKSCSTLSSDDISIGDSGAPPFKVLRATKVFTEQSFNDAMQSTIASEDGLSRLVVVPMDEVAAASTDLKANVAASLFLRSKAQ
jgi:hypothetical protein